MKDENYIERYNSIKGMAYQVLRDNENARNSQEWTAHIIQKECAMEYYGKELHELSKSQRLALPKRSSISRAVREIQNDMGKFEPEEEVKLDQETKRKALHQAAGSSPEKVTKL